ncbi:tRNA (guanine-N(7)-)-methyltransferase [Jonquetella anthropi DSM 22815]|uniref:tRNA (guanine-N(7)-)-methyltransferase n=1 Tax=Jonquetella anthropi DSM 22815 TaxID=885272 RepID=H0UJV1_9BACT|nr:tRNA (guanosine(46)-N7)-methyltransferase TrmB [Jonquetella anthropi]EHM12960.1 tRNA (guanine-N(7)-)-methyltransferase [Jonquetella anthropi DSM 22815]
MRRGEILLSPDAGAQLPELTPPVIAEIGFGNGEFMTHLASRRPDATVVGLEVSMTCVEKALTRVRRQGLPNVRILLGDARFLLRECFPDGTFERIYMSFPCPWPKERHAKRRVTAEGFSSTLAAVLALGGVFELATDEGWYADEVASVLGSHPALSLEKRLLNHRREITTKYEKRWLEEGKDIHHLYFVKKAPWTVQRLTGPKGEDAMHVHVPGSSFDPDALAQAVRGRVGRTGEAGGEQSGFWAFHSVWTGEDAALVEAICTDDGFEQKFYFKVVRRDDGLLVKLDGIHLPYLTPSVRGALADLAGLVS